MSATDDIANWSAAGSDFAALFARDDEGDSRRPEVSMSIVNVDPLRVYALLKHFISPKPNGIYTFMSHGKPMENLVWWDFALQHEETFIQIARTVSRLEATTYGKAPFDVQEFIEINLTRYRSEVDTEAQSFEHHSVFINHFRSYQRCVEYLWSEIEPINNKPPEIPEGHLQPEETVQNYITELETFTKDSIKMHALGKSLILNAAFMVESFVNHMIRIGAAPPLRLYESGLRMYLRSKFKEKLELLKPFTQIIAQDLDMNSKPVRDALELMQLRNKYVHSDESSQHNKVGDVFFDGDYPLFPIAETDPLIEHTIRSFHNPSKAKIAAAQDTAIAFCEYLESRLHPKLREELRFILSQDQLGFNQKRQVYSVVYSSQPLMFYLMQKESSEEN